MPEDNGGGAAVAEKPAAGGANGAGAGAGSGGAGGAGAGSASDAGAASSSGGGGKPAAAGGPAGGGDGKPADGAGKPESLLGDAKADGKAGADKQPDKSQTQTGAPEKGYADFKLPEGLKTDSKLMDGFKDMAKGLNLSQDSAQKFVDLQANSVLAEQKAFQEAVTKQQATWADETKKALGADYQKELSFAARAMDGELGGPLKLRDALVQLGLANHPVITQFLVKIGKGMAEEKPVEADRSGVVDETESAKRSMFPSMYNQDGTRK